MNEQLKQAIHKYSLKYSMLCDDDAYHFALDILSDPEIMRQAGWVRIEEAQKAVKEYYKTEGCGCCGDYEGHHKASIELGKLLNFTPYSDGSGYDLSTPLPQPPNNKP